MSYTKQSMLPVFARPAPHCRTRCGRSPSSGTAATFWSTQPVISGHRQGLILGYVCSSFHKRCESYVPRHLNIIPSPQVGCLQPGFHLADATVGLFRIRVAFNNCVLEGLHRALNFLRPSVEPIRRPDPMKAPALTFQVLLTKPISVARGLAGVVRRTVAFDREHGSARL